MTGVAAPGPGVRGTEPLSWGLTAFLCLLPLHAVVIAFLFGGLGWPAGVVRGVAAWKETLAAGLVIFATMRAVRGRGTGLGIQWPDLAVSAMAALAVAYLVGAEWWFNQGLPVAAQLYGWRDAVFACLLYFVGRATPEVAENPRILWKLFAVGLVTSGIAVVEEFFVTPRTLVVLGTASYVQQFLGAMAITRGNVYGLPDNYWTLVGGHLVQRAGSTYLSSQGFAIPFLIILPAALLWLLSGSPRRRLLPWVGYALLWAGLLLTLTRMTIVVCVLQAFVLIAAWRRWGVGVGLMVIAITCFAAALLLVPGLPTFVWETMTWQTGSSVTHLADWGTALNNVLAYPLGAGLGAADFAALRFGLSPLAADNEYFKYAVQLGVLGLALYVLMMGGLCAVGFRAWRMARHWPLRASGLLVATAALGMAVNALTAVVTNSVILAYTFYWLAGSVTSATARAEVAERGKP